MVYLTKKETKRIIRGLANNSDKEIINIVEKLKFPEKRKIYYKTPPEVRKLLKKAFREKRKLKISYYSPHSDEHTTRIIEIYQLHENAIVTFCYLRKGERVFSIGRIKSATLLDDKYKIPKNWSPENIILN